MGWVHHIDITVSDLAIFSTAFYAQVLELMGFRRIRDGGGVPLWAGDRMEVGLRQGHPGHNLTHDRYSPGLHHLAFGAPDRAAVERVYDSLLKLGVKILMLRQPMSNMVPDTLRCSSPTQMESNWSTYTRRYRQASRKAEQGCGPSTR